MKKVLFNQEEPEFELIGSGLLPPMPIKIAYLYTDEKCTLTLSDKNIKSDFIKEHPGGKLYEICQVFGNEEEIIQQYE
jgi:hypothetical protein